MTHPLMQYLPPAGQQPQLQQPSGADKYVGEVAANYDAKRENTPKHIAEQKVVEAFLDDLPEASWILDAPCGTGRFFDCYARKNFIVRGLDVSADMLNQAARKIKAPLAMIGEHKQWGFAQGDILNSGIPDKAVDAAVNVRITRWIMGKYGPEGIVRMLQEMQRIARQRMIFTARVKDHPYAVPYDLINAALDGWAIFRDEAGYQDAYRVIEARPVCPKGAEA